LVACAREARRRPPAFCASGAAVVSRSAATSSTRSGWTPRS